MEEKFTKDDGLYWGLTEPYRDSPQAKSADQIGTQAENLRIVGKHQIRAAGSDYNGRGYVQWDSPEVSIVTHAENAGVPMPYTVKIRYACDADRRVKLRIKGKVLDVELASTGSLNSKWQVWSSEVIIGTGSTAVVLYTEDAFGPNIDELTIEPLRKN